MFLRAAVFVSVLVPLEVAAGQRVKLIEHWDVLQEETLLPRPRPATRGSPRTGNQWPSS